ncbi:PEP-CTERM sorting domain-containing protein [[Empedobacter] haloabium]|uniref:PEP-CTERM sorting domain-containing protein n=1 Tax=[Empedobacter] haloabium TaxID=592317 RepID=A0ABZ1UGL5_9BURK
MNRKLFTAAFCSILFATSASAAGPVSTTSVKVSDVAFQVFDLTPADGIAAGYTIRDTYTLLEATLSRSGWDGNMYGSARDRPSSASTIELEYRNEYASASWNGALGGLSLSVTSSQSIFTGRVDASQSMLVTLAPHTVFVFSGLVAQSGTNPATQGWSYRLTSDFRAKIYDFGDPSHELLFERILGGDNVPDYAQTDPFSLTYVNDTDLPRELSVRMDTYAYAHAPIVPGVPEPSTYLMLGAGLLGICWRSRRGQPA